MPVLTEGTSVVIRADRLIEKFPGGWDEFKKGVPNKTLCADNELVRVGFMVALWKFTPCDISWPTMSSILFICSRTMVSPIWKTVWLRT